MRTRILWASLLTIMSTSLASASPITIPPGLAPGSIYFLAFVTLGTNDATSSDISSYDHFVTCEAKGGLMCEGHAAPDPMLAALDTTWKVIGSTAAVDAIDHVSVGAADDPANLYPVFNLAGSKLADSVPELFDSSRPDIPIDRNQFGDTYTGLVWTGTLPSGLGAEGPPDHTLGAFCDDTISEGCLVQVGETQMGLNNFFWLEAPIHSQAPTTQNPFYAMSGPLLVPVPEPGTIRLMLGPALLLLGMLRRRRHV